MREAMQRIQRSAYLPLRNLSCDCRQGVLVIRGRVPTYYLKQLAQTLISGLEGIREVENLIEVVLPGGRHTDRGTDNSHS
jgi:hypothetical protein